MLDDINDEDLDEVVSLETIVASGETDQVMLTLLSRIPIMAGSDKKSSYLAYRSTGFPVKQAAQLTGVPIAAVRRWRKQDAMFKRVEDEYLPQLQQQVGIDIVKFEFLRNLRLVIAKDAQLLAKFFSEGPSGFSPAEWDYVKLVRKHYTPSDLLALEKVLHPEKHHDQVKISLSWTKNAPDEYDTDEPSVEAEYRNLDDE